MFVIQVKKPERGNVWRILRDNGIMSGVSFFPVYKNPYYQQNGYRDIYCIESEDFYETALSLPCFPKLKDEEVDMVINVLKRIV